VDGVDGTVPVCGNGVAEPGEECDGDPARSCLTDCATAGSRACTGCAWDVACTPPAETCNGLDDDCDTVADDAFECRSGAAEPCTDGCRTCSTSCSWSPCRAAREEWCDDVDDDCDGRPDDGLWCWRNPVPTGMGIHDLWAANPAEAWAVDGARLLRWNGVYWSGQPPSLDRYPLSLWGFSADDVWLAYAGGATPRGGTLHWNGSLWQEIPVPPDFLPQGLGGAAPEDLWVVGYSGKAVRWDGSSWSEVPTGSDERLRAVWAGSSDDVWTVGGDGVFHWDGATWSRFAVDVPAWASLSDVWGAASDDVWVAGLSDSGTLMHWNGSAWTEVPSATSGYLEALWGPAPDDVWAVGVPVQHWDGSEWTDLSADVPACISAPVGITFYAAHGTAADDLWLGGLAGRLVHRSGGTWSCSSSGVAPLAWLEDVWAAPGGGAWAVGWSEGDTEATTVRCTESGCTAVPTGTDASLWGVWGSAPDDVWAVGAGHDESSHYGVLLHWDGSTWSSARSETTTWLGDVWGSAANDVWAVGGEGTVLRWDGRAWGVVPAASTAHLRAVWGFSAADVWVAGDDPPTVLRWDGSSWSEVWDAGWLSQVNSFWGLSPDDIRLGDADGRIFHWDGSSWSVEYSPAEPYGSIDGICGPSRDDIWAVGSNGLMLHWDGTAWTGQPSGTANFLESMWCSPGAGAWAVGNYGTVLRRRE
jgi:hypothetical protein